MLYMIIESFKNRDPVPVYQRFRDQGRLAPSRHLLDQWIARWSDLVDFEVVPVITSAQAVEQVAPRL